MKNRRIASPFDDDGAGHRGLPVHGDGRVCGDRRRLLRLNPIVAIVIASAALAWVFGVDTNRAGFHRQALETSSPADAVDISLKRLMRTRVAERLEREHRWGAVPNQKPAITEGELARIREHPLYRMVKETMTDHLRNAGYDRVPTIPTMEPSERMLSMDAETRLNGFIHSLRASFPASNAKFAGLLSDQERRFGKSIEEHRRADSYDIPFTVLIQLLCECPDDLESVAGSVRLIPRPAEEIERTLRGKASQNHMD